MRRTNTIGAGNQRSTSINNNNSPKNRARGSSAIGSGIAKPKKDELSDLREVDDELDDDQVGSLNAQQINVKNFELNPVPAARSMQQKRTTSFGTGIGGGLKRPTALKQPTTNQPAAA